MLDSNYNPDSALEFRAAFWAIFEAWWQKYDFHPDLKRDGTEQKGPASPKAEPEGKAHLPTKATWQPRISNF